MSVTTLTLDDLYGEISDLARDQGISTKEQWDEMVENIIEDHLDLGELDLDQDTEGMKEILRSRWGVWKKESLISDQDKDKIEEDEEVEGEVEENVDVDLPDDLFEEDEEEDV